jgi:hypothetical protein
MWPFVAAMYSCTSVLVLIFVLVLVTHVLLVVHTTNIQLYYSCKWSDLICRTDDQFRARLLDLALGSGALEYSYRCALTVSAH